MRLARRSLALAFAATPMVAGRAPAQSPGLAGTLVVTNKTPSTATIIDVATGRALATLPTGQGPHEVALSRDGGTAVVTDYGSPQGNTLTVIDVPGLRVARTISLGEYRRPHGVAFLPGDSLVAVTSEATGNVVVVHVGAGAVRRAIPTTQAGSHMVGVVSDGARAYTGNIGSATASELDLRAGRFVRTFAVPAQPEAINVTPDGAEVWVGSNATGRVSVIDPRAATVTTAAEGFGWPYRVLFTPDVRTVLLPDLKNEELRFLDRATRRELSRLSFKGGGPQGITITPDGRHVFESLSTQARVVIIDVPGRRVLGYLPAGDTPDGVVYTTRVVAR
ncbi:MAG: YncE family protein [Gemmatirosa sp.]|nr:YncE family protein [Gemmatirosa sp.]